MSGPDRGRPRLSLQAALSEGLSLAGSRNGLVLFTVYLALEVLTVLLTIAGSSYLPLDQAAGVGDPSALPVGETLPAIELSGASTLTFGFVLLFSVPLTIVAIRTFVVGATNRIPDVALFHRLGRATITGVAAALVIVVSLAAVFGAGYGCLYLVEAYSAQLGAIGTIAVLLAFVVGLPTGFFGIVVHVFFVHHEIAVRDRGLRDAVRGSWALVRGERVRVFLLVLAYVGVSVLVRPNGWPTGEGLDPLAVALLLGRTTVYAGLWVVMTAVIARTYRQLAPAAADDVGP